MIKLFEKAFRVVGIFVLKFVLLMSFSFCFHYVIEILTVLVFFIFGDSSTSQILVFLLDLLSRGNKILYIILIFFSDLIKILPLYVLFLVITVGCLALMWLQKIDTAAFFADVLAKSYFLILVILPRLLKQLMETISSILLFDEKNVYVINVVRDSSSAGHAGGITYTPEDWPVLWFMLDHTLFLKLEISIVAICVAISFIFEIWYLRKFFNFCKSKLFNKNLKTIDKKFKN